MRKLLGALRRAVNDFDMIADGDKIVVGEIGDSSPLPRVAKGWTASRKTIDGKGMLMLSKGVGFQVIVR